MNFPTNHGKSFGSLACSQKYAEQNSPFLERKHVVTFANSFLTPQIVVTTTEAPLYRIIKHLLLVNTPLGLILDFDSFYNSQKDGASDSHFLYDLLTLEFSKFNISQFEFSKFKNIRDFCKVINLSQVLFSHLNNGLLIQNYIIKLETPVFHSAYFKKSVLSVLA